MNFKENQTTQKLRGGYYTPDDLASFLTKWVSECNPKVVLEPSCGDGIFLSNISKHIKNAEAFAFEIDKAEYIKANKCANQSGLKNYTVYNEDFLGWAIARIKEGTQQVDAVVGNPPFVRYQYLPPTFQDRAQIIFEKLNCKFTKHTNAWVPFILASFAMLRPGGRLAMVVPSEIIHVTHARSLRSYLGSNSRRIVIIDPQEIWFSGTLQGAVLLLAEKKRDPNQRAEGVGIYPVKGKNFISEMPEKIFRLPHPINGRTVAGKWTRALLDETARNLIDSISSHEDVHFFSSIAKVDVGIVTGANKFFLVDDLTVKKYKLSAWAHPMFGRSEHCPGIIYDRNQHKENAKKGKPTNFLWFKDAQVEYDFTANEYIKLGVKQKLHNRYKCRIRSPWYSVPSVYTTEIGMLKRSHDAPRLILNKLKALTTDTAYRINFNEGSPESFVYNFINPLTALSAELEGRHYGGGVLELVPSEIEKLLIPMPTSIIPDVKHLDSIIRTNKIEASLEIQSKIILGSLGISNSEQNILLCSWKKLRDRRQRISS